LPACWPKLQAELGRTVLVDNRPGAGGQIAAQQLKAARADGTTLFLSHDHTISILPQVVKKPGFDPHADFEPVGGFATFVNGLAVSGGTPARSLPAFIDWVKARGGQAPSAFRRRRPRPSSWCSCWPAGTA
jgi:tripartite-type tricarboxylate transporter receptor subunit TctC